MDVDRFIAENRPTWDRLDYLALRPRALSGEEIRELAVLYQRTAGHLAYAQANFRDPEVIAALTRRVVGAYAVLYGARRRTWRTVWRFFSETFPLVFWQMRWYLLVSALALFVPALAAGAWIDHSHSALNATMPAAVREAYVNHDFSSYYSSEPSAAFASQVYFNNVEVSMEAFAGGILFGLGTLAALFFNGLNLGVAGGLFYAVHRPGEFWGLVTPHGLLELTSVTMAGAAGLRIGWALVRPGDYPRSVALRQAGPEAITLVIATILTLAVAGSIEGFVTGSGLPTALRVGTGALVEVVFLLWVILFGRAARQRSLHRGR
ncbi:MAG TPA: stage II sporulation protein M [Acidimicrobiales bacterium]|nr:stage II sporulation protein M [Acidimicrobiales bacterium]